MYRRGMRNGRESSWYTSTRIGWCEKSKSSIDLRWTATSLAWEYAKVNCSLLVSLQRVQTQTGSRIAHLNRYSIKSVLVHSDESAPLRTRARPRRAQTSQALYYPGTTWSSCSWDACEVPSARSNHPRPCPLILHLLHLNQLCSREYLQVGAMNVIKPLVIVHPHFGQSLRIRPMHIQVASRSCHVVRMASTENMPNMRTGNKF